MAPYPDDLGRRILQNVCASCWSEYMSRQTMVINEYRLDLMDPRAQEILTADMVEFLGLAETGGEASPPSEDSGSGREKDSLEPSKKNT
jgi:Fe-S cluster biosynthesis and repair protein YggX